MPPAYPLHSGPKPAGGYERLVTPLMGPTFAPGGGGPPKPPSPDDDASPPDADGDLGIEFWVAHGLPRPSAGGALPSRQFALDIYAASFPLSDNGATLVTPSKPVTSNESLPRLESPEFPFVLGQHVETGALLMFEPGDAHEQSLWDAIEPFKANVLRFWADFLGLATSNRAKLDDDCMKRLNMLIRAMSWVESLHGTGKGNQPGRDPFQSGNPNDAHWKDELFGEGKVTDIVREGKGRPNVPYNKIIDAAESACLEQQARLEKALPNYLKRTAASLMPIPCGLFGLTRMIGKQAGHNDPRFNWMISYLWGILYLLVVINQLSSTTGKVAAWELESCKWSDLIDKAVGYNGKGAGGGDPKYKEKLTDALKKLGVDVDK